MDSILKYLRFPEASISGFLWTIVAIAVILFFVFVVVRYLRNLLENENAGAVADIREQLIQRGLAAKDIGFFLQLIRERRVKKPRDLFLNSQELKNFLIESIIYIETKFPEGGEKLIEAKSALYRVLNGSLVPYKRKSVISDTKILKNNQSVAIEYEKKVIRTNIIKVDPQFLLIEKNPVSDQFPKVDFLDKELAVYFFLPNDSGYVFRERVQRVIHNERLTAFMVNHTDKILRVQKRKLIRKESSLKTDCVLLALDDTTKKFNKVGEIDNCTILDVSAGGCKVKMPSLGDNVYVYRDSWFMSVVSFSDGSARILCKTVSIDTENGIVHAQFVKFLDNSYVAINDYIFGD